MISNLLGIPFPTKDNPSTNSFIDDQYWRVLFALPMAFSVIQSILLFTMFNYETPKFLKQTGRDAELNIIMGKIYSKDQVQSRIDGIVIASGSGGPTYGETLSSPKYMVSTLIGCTLSIL